MSDKKKLRQDLLRQIQIPSSNPFASARLAIEIKKLSKEISDAERNTGGGKPGKSNPGGPQ